MHQELKQNQKKGYMNKIVSQIDTMKMIERGIVNVIRTGIGNIEDIKKG